MDTFFDSIDLQFITPRKPKQLRKYAILLNEPKSERSEELLHEPCKLAAELLPIEVRPIEDLVQLIGETLQTKIKTHGGVKKVPIFTADEIVEKNSATLVPVMYRIALEHFVQSNASTFKIIECRNVTKLISDWKPSLPDKLISLGHQVIVVQLKESFVPYTDFAYAILRQLDYEWSNRLPRSFFFPDDVCIVNSTPERDLCVVSPSMPDGDLEINRKMGLLNYELLMMIKSSCMSAMKNYLMKRDLRVGKFSDTLDGVSALRQLYRKLQDRLKTGRAIELGSNSLEDLRKLVKQAIGGSDVLAAQTWIEYGNKMGLNIPPSPSSSSTSISSVEQRGGGCDDETWRKTGEAVTTSSSSSGFDMDDGKDSQEDTSFRLGFPLSPTARNDELSSGVLLPSDVQNGDDGGSNATFTQQCNKVNSKEGNEGNEDGGFNLEDFTEFKDSLEKMHKIRDDAFRDEEEWDQELPEHEFSADSILQILKSSNKA